MTFINFLSLLVLSFGLIGFIVPASTMEPEGLHNTSCNITKNINELHLSTELSKKITSLASESLSLRGYYIQEQYLFKDIFEILVTSNNIMVPLKLNILQKINENFQSGYLNAYLSHLTAINDNSHPKATLHCSLPKIIYIVANEETRGDGIHIDTMDHFRGGIYPEMSLLIPALNEYQCQVKVLNWQDNSCDWQYYKEMVIGPAWGYTLQGTAFKQWLQRIQPRSLVNKKDFVLWNLHKTYLIDLQNHGIPTIPSFGVTQDNPLRIEDILQQAKDKFKTTDIILKGLLGAGGFDYHHVKLEDLNHAQSHLDHLLQNHEGAVVQPFLEGFSQWEELSFVFFGPIMSHSFLKVAAPNQELIQEFYGGQSFHIKPEDLNNNENPSLINHIKSFRPDLKLTLEDLQKSHFLIWFLLSDIYEFFSNKGISHPDIFRLDCLYSKPTFDYPYGRLYLCEIEGIEPYKECKRAIEYDPSKRIAQWWAH